MSLDQLLYIDGELVPSVSGKSYQSLNPATGQPIATVPWAEAQDCELAIDAARRAFDRGNWRDADPGDRAKMLEKLAAGLKERAEDIALSETRDAGALIGKAHTDVALAASQLRQFARMAAAFNTEPEPIEGMQKPGRSFAYRVRQPIGVAAGIIPWNFPLNMAIWKIGQALATGNTLVLKCAPETPLTALKLGEIAREAGLPAGVLNIITGDVEVGETLVRSPKVDKLSFTGSTEIGQRVMSEAAATMKRVTLECGGKSANIVLDDADREMAIDGALYATFFHSGQVCESGTRLMLSKAKHDDFVEALVERARGLKVGDPMDPETNIGPIISEKQRDRIRKYIEIGKFEGATLALGGDEPKIEGLEGGWFVNPAIFTNVNNDMRIAREEIFGPVLSVLAYEDQAEAIRLANDSDYGLAAGVWSADEDAAMDIASRLDAGWVWINEWHILSPLAPFGGFKRSGIGREFGEEGLNAYTEVKTIYRDDIGNRAGKPWYDVVVPARPLAD